MRPSARGAFARAFGFHPQPRVAGCRSGAGGLSSHWLPNVRVEPKVVRLPQNRVDLIFEISEGRSSHIGAVTFVGNRRFSDGDLRDVIATKEHAWWAFLATGDTYDPDRLTYDRELLREHYLRQGYADFRVLSAVAELALDGQTFWSLSPLTRGCATGSAKLPWKVTFPMSISTGCGHSLTPWRARSMTCAMSIAASPR